MLWVSIQTEPLRTVVVFPLLTLRNSRGDTTTSWQYTHVYATHNLTVMRAQRESRAISFAIVLRFHRYDIHIFIFLRFGMCARSYIHILLQFFFIFLLLVPMLPKVPAVTVVQWLMGWDIVLFWFRMEVLFLFPFRPALASTSNPCISFHSTISFQNGYMCLCWATGADGSPSARLAHHSYGEYVLRCSFSLIPKLSIC